MKGPKAGMLSGDVLAEVYTTLNVSPLAVDEIFLAFAVEHSRLDPRLAEITTEHIRDFWWKYNPNVLAKKLLNTAWPAAVLPMLLLIENRCKTSKSNLQRFKKWSGVVRKQVDKESSPQTYFIPLSMAEVRMRRDEHKKTLPEFFENGYLCRTLLFNKDNPKELSSASNNRLSLLNREKLKAAKHLSKLLGDLNTIAAAQKLDTDKTTISKIRRLMVSDISLDFLYTKLGMLHG